MKKLLLGIVLIVVLVAISWVKVSRDREREAASRLEGLKVGAAKIEQQQGKIDSLASLVGKQDSSIVESLAVRDSLLDSVTDSLSGVIESQGERIEQLKQEKYERSASPPVPEKSAPKKAAHKDILAFYKQEIEKLPPDLSDYERRVASEEIREETAKRFSITVKRLDEIREMYELDY